MANGRGALRLNVRADGGGGLSRRLHRPEHHQQSRRTCEYAFPHGGDGPARMLAPSRMITLVAGRRSLLPEVGARQHLRLGLSRVAIAPHLIGFKPVRSDSRKVTLSADRPEDRPTDNV